MDELYRAGGYTREVREYGLPDGARGTLPELLAATGLPVHSFGERLGRAWRGAVEKVPEDSPWRDFRLFAADVCPAWGARLAELTAETGLHPAEAAVGTGLRPVNADEPLGPGNFRIVDNPRYRRPGGPVQLGDRRVSVDVLAEEADLSPKTVRRLLAEGRTPAEVLAWTAAHPEGAERGAYHASWLDADHHAEREQLRSMWDGMVNRCTNPQAKGFERYGGRGIAVHPRWRVREQFVDDVLEGYLAHVAAHGRRQTTLDRIDPDGDYAPDNCRWATYRQQNINRRGAHQHVLRDGRRLNTEQFAEAFGVSIDFVGRCLHVWRRIKGAHTWPCRGHFLEDCVPGFTNGLVMARRDPSKPLGPDNHWWALSNRASAASGELPDGTPCTRADLAAATGLTVNQVTVKLRSGVTAAELWLAAGNPSTAPLRARRAFPNGGARTTVVVVNGRAYTLRQLGPAFGLTDAQVRQLHSAWLNTCTHPVGWPDESAFVAWSLPGFRACLARGGRARLQRRPGVPRDTPLGPATAEWRAARTSVD